MEVDLSTEYLGLKLTSPVMASASPCTGQPDVLKRLEANGVGAAVLPSLFEEQINGGIGCPQNLGSATESARAASLFPTLIDYNRGPDCYVNLIDEARRAVSMPIIASLNAATPTRWVEYAKRIADAGADALELNLYFVPTDANVTGAQVETQYLDVIASIRQRMDLPLAIKIGPYFSSLPNFALRAVEAGADGLVLFNRFLEPEIDLDARRVEPHLELSRSADLRLPLRWLAILRSQLSCCSLATTSGVHTGHDALKALAAGADVVMIASALLKHGVEHLQTIEAEMIQWLADHEYFSVTQLSGRIAFAAGDQCSAFDRANYASTLASYLDEGACSN